LDGLEDEGEEDQGLVDALEGIESATQEAEFIADPSLNPSDLEPTSLRTVAEAAWDRTDSGDGELNVSLPNSDRVIADRTTLELLFANLFRNGVEHGDGNVVVETVEEDGSSGFAVTDSGPGIPELGQERIFEWGFAHDDDTGVGLAIVREVVDSHGWEITAKTGPDGGARFEITNVTFT
jgi:signal transduction histidine kinase